MTMIIGSLVLQIYVPESGSLKTKRQVVQSLIAGLRREFNASVAEVDHLDSWQRADVAVVCVSNDRRYAEGLLQRAVNYVENGRFDLVLLDYELEVY